MRTIIVTLLVCLLATTAFAGKALRKAVPAKNPLFHTLAQLDSHHLGNTILSAITIQLQTGGAIEEIEDLLSEILDQLHTEQVTEDAQFEQADATCNTRTNDLNNAIDADNAQIELLKDNISRAKSDLSAAEALLAETQGELANVNQKLEEGQAQRDQEHEDFVSRQQDHADAIAAIKEAISIFTPLSQGGAVSFIQQNKLKGINEKLQSLLQKRSSLKSELAPIIITLSQIASKADPVTVAKILSLMNRLEDALILSQSDDEHHENTQQANWDELKADLQNQAQNLSAIITETENNIEDLKSTIATNETALEFAEQQLAADQEALVQLTQWCQTERNNYDNSQSTRTDLYERVNAVLTYVQNNVATLKDYLKDRINNQ